MSTSPGGSVHAPIRALCPAVAECASRAGAEVVLTLTACYV